jgi:ornithine carbamoyltransferase
MKKDLVSLSDLTKEDISDLFALTRDLKTHKLQERLRGKTLGMIFEKPSTRTSISFAVGMYQLGGLPLMLSAHDMQLYRGESITDTARVISRYLDIIMIRANAHASVVELAACADIPVINGLTDQEHPCQILADLFTILEKRVLPKSIDNIRSLKLAYIGDGNNIANSWILAAGILGMRLTVSCPAGYEPEKAILKQAQTMAAVSGAQIVLEQDPHKAVEQTDIIYTDVWTSMGREKENETRKKVFKPYQINQSLVDRAAAQCLVMHCLPAHRGEEITDEVLDGSHSIVFDEAENRLHVQKAILVTLLHA